MKKKIAWIEDDIDVIDAVVRPLVNAGFEFKEFHTYSEVLDNLEEIFDCDLILLDLIFPPGQKAKEIEVDDEPLGLKFLEVVKEHKPQIPIIILSVIAKTESVDKKLDDYRAVLNFRQQPKAVRPSKLKALVYEMLKIEEE